MKKYILSSVLFLLFAVLAPEKCFSQSMWDILRQQKQKQKELPKKLKYFSEKYKGKQVYILKKGTSDAIVPALAVGEYASLPANNTDHLFATLDTTVVWHQGLAKGLYCEDVKLGTTTASNAPNVIVLILKGYGRTAEMIVCGQTRVDEGGYDWGETHINVKTKLGDIETSFDRSYATIAELDSLAKALQPQYSRLLADKRIKDDEHQLAKEAEERKKQAEEENRKAITEKYNQEAAGILNIVGVNTERAAAKNDYYSNPISLEKYMGKNDPSRNAWWGDYPSGQQLYYTNSSYSYSRENYSYGSILDVPRLLQKEGTVLYAVAPHPGLYTVSGVLVCKEECVFIESSTLSFKRLPESDYITQDIRDIEVVISNSIKEAPTYKELQNRILEGKGGVKPVFYILTDSNGESYYALPSRGIALKTDFYQRICDEFKGQRLLYVDSGESHVIRDYYDSQLRLKIPTVSPKQIIENPSAALNNSSFFCKDVVIDSNNNNDVILAVLENTEKTASVSLFLYAFRRERNNNLPDNGYFIRYYCKNHFSGPYLEICDDGRIYEFKSIMSEKSVSECTSQIKMINKNTNLNKQEEKNKQRSRRDSIISQYGMSYGEKILAHQLSLGMTPEMCIESIGRPSRTFKTTTASEEVMVYYYAFMAVYFNDGKLTRIDELH